jgi:hypothetical protein
VFEKRKLAKAHAERDAQLRQFVNGLIDDDGSLSEQRERSWTDYLLDHGYADEQDRVVSTELPADVVDTILLGKANDGRFAALAEAALLLKHDEVAYCEKAAGLLKEVTDREFQGGSRGVSVPLGHGVRFRTGGVRGRMVTVGAHLEVADTGYLTVTDRRVVFHGGRKTLEFLYAKLATLNVYSDAIDLGVTNRQTTSTFRLAAPQFVAGMIRAAHGASAIR